MRSILAATAIALNTQAHPFVGEHADARFVHHEEGRFSARLHAQNKTNLSSFK
jgi:hypothetical protein